MCLAEALLRIPDAETADALIRDKLAGTQWDSADEAEGGLLVNAATWGLMLTGRLAAWRDAPGDEPARLLRRLVARAGEPVVRTAIRQAMKIMAEQFIVGETIDDAIERAAEREALGYRFSYDMLGEAARTARDAERYFAAYEAAIEAVARAALRHLPVEARPESRSSSPRCIPDSRSRSTRASPPSSRHASPCSRSAPLWPASRSRSTRRKASGWS